MLLAVADAHHTFLWAKVGSPGSNSNCGIFSESFMSQTLERNTVGFPEPDFLPDDDLNMPYFFVGDDACPLRTYMMKPYPISISSWTNVYITTGHQEHAG